jgi:hypothetical protein
LAESSEVSLHNQAKNNRSNLREVRISFHLHQHLPFTLCDGTGDSYRYSIMSQPPLCNVTCTNKTPSNADLFGTSCLFNNTVLANCQQACLNVGYQFSSAATILGCDQFSQVQNFDSPSKNAPCNTTYVNTVLDMFNGCMAQYCEHPDPTLGGCPQTAVSFAQDMCDGSLPYARGVMTSILTLSDPQGAKACQILARSVNGDIGGIGVSNSLETSHILTRIGFHHIHHSAGFLGLVTLAAFGDWAHTRAVPQDSRVDW